jgi:serine protease Do
MGTFTIADGHPAAEDSSGFFEQTRQRVVQTEGLAPVPETTGTNLRIEIMNRSFKTWLGVAAVSLGGLAAFTAVESRSIGRDTNALPRFNVQDAPISRDTRGVTSFAPVIKRAAPSVVNIYSTRVVRERDNSFLDDPMFRQFFGDRPDGSNRGGGPNRGGRRSQRHREQGLGSGVIVSADGYIITANHVIEGADEIKVALAAGGKEYTAKIIGADPPTDVAVLKIDARDLKAIAIADSDKLEVGDLVLAIGNPFGVGQTVTMGIVSALGRTSLDITPNGYENFIQTDAAINPGNSGGALVDADGRLVGINTAILTHSGGYQGVGFAVPVNMARSVMERLITYGKVTRGYLGVDIQSLTPELADQFGLSDPTGALVTDVLPNSPAAKAGLQNGDVVRDVNGKPIADSAQLRLTISQTAPGSKVELKILRGVNGRKPAERSITAVLGTLPADAGRGGGSMAPDEQGNSESDALDGVEVSDLDSSARQQYDIPANIRGALITAVDPDSTSADAGLHEGDVIMEIDRQPVRNADDAVELSKKVKADRVLLRIYRGHGSIYITVENSKTTKEK